MNVRFVIDDRLNNDGPSEVERLQHCAEYALETFVTKGGGLAGFPCHYDIPGSDYDTFASVMLVKPGISADLDS